MNAVNILEQGHQALLQAVDGITGIDWERPGVSGTWSVKDILSHLTAYEYVLADTLYGLRGGKTTPTLDRWMQGEDAFNRYEIELRRCDSIDDILREYHEAHTETIAQLIRIPDKTLRQLGSLPWYGATSDAEDFIADAILGHKREHAAQIAAYRDQLTAEPVWQVREAS